MPAYTAGHPGIPLTAIISQQNKKKGKRIDCGDSTTREDEKNEMRRPMRTEAEEEDGDGRMEDTRRIPKKTTGETGDRRY